VPVGLFVSVPTPPTAQENSKALWRGKGVAALAMLLSMLLVEEIPMVDALERLMCHHMHFVCRALPWLDSRPPPLENNSKLRHSPGLAP